VSRLLKCRLQVNEAAEQVYDLVDNNANLIFGAVVDPNMPNGEVCCYAVRPTPDGGADTFFFWSAIHAEFRNLGLEYCGIVRR
jgi:hypothetical protein